MSPLSRSEGVNKDHSSVLFLSIILVCTIHLDYIYCSRSGDLNENYSKKGLKVVAQVYGPI